MFSQSTNETIISPGEIHRRKSSGCAGSSSSAQGTGRVEANDSACCHCSSSGGPGRGRDGTALLGHRHVAMTGSGPKLGVLLLLAVLLQTVVVTITVLHFTTALNSVRKSTRVPKRRRTEAFTHGRAVRTAGCDAAAGGRGPVVGPAVDFSRERFLLCCCVQSSPSELSSSLHDAAQATRRAFTSEATHLVMFANTRKSRAEAVCMIGRGYARARILLRWCWWSHNPRLDSVQRCSRSVYRSQSFLAQPYM